MKSNTSSDRRMPITSDAYITQDGADYVLLRVYRAMNKATLLRRVRRVLKDHGVTGEIVSTASGMSLFGPEYARLYKCMYVEVTSSASDC